MTRPPPVTVRIMGVHLGKPFVAGVVVGVRAAPIVRYMAAWSLPRIKDYCEKLGWKVEQLSNGTELR